MKDMEKKMKWIKITDRLPESEGEILIYVNGYCTLGKYNISKKIFQEFAPNMFETMEWLKLENVTHWMPLPNPPENQ
jgi:hypothetical protein